MQRFRCEAVSLAAEDLAVGVGQFGCRLLGSGRLGLDEAYRDCIAEGLALGVCVPTSTAP